MTLYARTPAEPPPVLTGAASRRFSLRNCTSPFLLGAGLSIDNAVINAGLAHPVARRLDRDVDVGSDVGVAQDRRGEQQGDVTLNSCGNFPGTPTSSPRDEIPQNERPRTARPHAGWVARNRSRIDRLLRRSPIPPRDDDRSDGVVGGQSVAGVGEQPKQHVIVQGVPPLGTVQHETGHPVAGPLNP